MNDILKSNTLSKNAFGLKSKNYKSLSKDINDEPTYKLRSSKGIKYTGNGKTYHVFLMERTDTTDDYYYNLVVSETDGLLEKYIYKYPLDESKNITITKIGNSTINSKNTSNSTKTANNCVTTPYFMVIPCPCVGHIDRRFCTCFQPPIWVYSHSITTCTAPTPVNPPIIEPDNDIDPDITIGGTRINGLDASGCYSNGDCLPFEEDPDAIVPYTPIPTLTPEDFDFPEEDSILISELNLNNEQKFWLKSLENINFKSDIENYLNTFNFYSPEFNEAKLFARQAVIAWMLSRNTVINFEEKIINELTGKALCIYNKLKSSSAGFKNAIKKFDGDFPVSHLKFEIDPNESSNTRKAYTTPPSNYLISIVLNGNSTKDASYQQRPNLMVAKTIIHEVIHAEMWRKILSIMDNGGNLQGITRQQWIDKLSNSDYPGIFDFYTRFGTNGFQHPQMAANYRNVIADALQAFDNNANPRQLYEDLAWEGLIYQKDPTWGSLSLSEKTRIQNTINNYFNLNKNESCNE